MDTLIPTYEARAKTHEEEAQTLASRYFRGSLFRLGYFIALVGLNIYFATIHPILLLISLFVGIFGFGRLIIWHQRLQQRKNLQEALATINHREVAAAKGDYSSINNGASFLDASHPYAIDLDIFGHASFFHMVNRASTSIGRQQLAHYLTAPGTEAPFSLDIIHDRQAAIQDLTPKLDWRQQFQAIGLNTQDAPQHLNTLADWLKMPDFVRNQGWIKVALLLNPIIVLGGVGFAIWQAWSFWQGVIFILPAFWILRKTYQRVTAIHERTAKAAKILSQYALLIAHIEQHSFEAPLLQELHNNFLSDGITASKRLKRLSYIIQQLNVRYNIFAIFLNLIGLWDLFWVGQLENWKAKYRAQLPQWFNSLQEFEALQSLATAYYNNPDWSMPIIKTEGPIEAEQLGHPLIRAKERVANDAVLPTHAHIKLLTGSNMAGKSTFLRTVGLNIVLAMAGAPVCAGALRLPMLRVYTSMRTQDALHESTSSFYAELKRLKTIIQAVEEQDNVLFLLDEILKGTNSTDRHTGSKALIRQMIESGGAGIIATHDLALGNMESQFPESIENWCIEVDIEDGKLFFDYKVKKGICRSFNASILMREMGIKIGEV